MRFLGRFQRLERARAPTTEAPAPEAERFTALERAGELPEVRTPSSGRFGPRELPLELDPVADDAQPFVRCPACGRDAQRGTVRCACDGHLDTPEVGEFNARLWEAEQGRRREESASHQAALERDLAAAAEHTAERRALGEQLARAVVRRERDAVPPLPTWTTVGWVTLVGLFAFRIHPLAAVALAGVVAAVVVVWWWRWKRAPDS